MRIQRVFIARSQGICRAFHRIGYSVHRRTKCLFCTVMVCIYGKVNCTLVMVSHSCAWLLYKTNLIETQINRSWRSNCDIHSVSFKVTLSYVTDRTAMTPIQNNALLVFFAGRGWAQIYERYMIVLHRGACTVRRAKHCSTALWGESIRTDKGIRTSRRHKSIM